MFLSNIDKFIPNIDTFTPNIGVFIPNSDMFLPNIDTFLANVDAFHSKYWQVYSKYWEFSSKYCQFSYKYWCILFQILELRLFIRNIDTYHSIYGCILFQISDSFSPNFGVVQILDCFQILTHCISPFGALHSTCTCLLILFQIYMQIFQILQNCCE